MNSPSVRIPVVDLAHYSRGTPKEKEAFIRTFGEGLLQFGFVSVENHGIADSLIRKTYEEVRRLFALPLETKESFHIPGGGGQRGYTGYGKEHAKNQKVGDMKEFWHVGRDLPDNHPKAAAYGNNLWPHELPEFKTSTQALFHALDDAGKVMLQALAEFFRAPKNILSDMAHEGNSILRLIHYPPLREKFIPQAVRAAEHEDINLITLLCEATSSGLEILTREGDWIAVEALKGQIVVDSGDMLSRVTNDVVPATTHRVVNPPSHAEDDVRYSMPFFMHPYPDCVLAPLSQCETEDNPRKHAPITADAYLRQRLQEIGLF